MATWYTKQGLGTLFPPYSVTRFPFFSKLFHLSFRHFLFLLMFLTFFFIFFSFSFFFFFLILSYFQKTFCCFSKCFVSLFSLKLQLFSFFSRQFRFVCVPIFIFHFLSYFLGFTFLLSFHFRFLAFWVNFREQKLIFENRRFQTQAHVGPFFHRFSSSLLLICFTFFKFSDHFSFHF